jgi:hypothetical protein
MDVWQPETDRAFVMGYRLHSRAPWVDVRALQAMGDGSLRPIPPTARAWVAGSVPLRPCGDSCSRRRVEGIPGHFTNDYLFATPPLAERLASFEIPNRPELWQLSDHLPLAARFEL